jgi:hypothetical protein
MLSSRRSIETISNAKESTEKEEMIAKESMDKEELMKQELTGQEERIDDLEQLYCDTECENFKQVRFNETPEIKIFNPSEELNSGVIKPELSTILELQENTEQNEPEEQGSSKEIINSENADETEQSGGETEESDENEHNGSDRDIKRSGCNSEEKNETVCKYVFKNGKSASKTCQIKKASGSDYCLKHSKRLKN